MTELREDKLRNWATPHTVDAARIIGKQTGWPGSESIQLTCLYHQRELNSLHVGLHFWWILSRIKQSHNNSMASWLFPSQNKNATQINLRSTHSHLRSLILFSMEIRIPLLFDEQILPFYFPHPFDIRRSISSSITHRPIEQVSSIHTYGAPNRFVKP